MFACKAAAGLIKSETLPPTEGAAAQHSLRAYLQIQDWMLLQSMSLNPDEYRWTIGVPTTPWLLKSYSGSQAVIVMEIVAPNGIVARMVSRVSLHAKLQRHYMQELHQ